MVTPVKPRFSHVWYSKQGVIYFIAAGTPPEAIKIGCTTRNQLITRLRAVHGMNHRDPALLGVIAFDSMREAESMEHQLHVKFADAQLRKPWTAGAEWFRPDPDIINFICENTTLPGSIPDFPNSAAIHGYYCWARSSVCG